MANTVTVSGMFGPGHTYFADSPVVIEITGLYWGNNTSPFTIVRVEVVWKRPTVNSQYGMITVGDFREDTGGQTMASFDISSALRAIWADYSFSIEVAAAQNAIASNAESEQPAQRAMREYILRIYTEYMASDGVFTTTQCTDESGHTDIPGGQCLIGGRTEWERWLITANDNRDVSYLEHKGLRNGDASTKPTSTPERVGSDSITSWVDVKSNETKSIFYPAETTPEDDDPEGGSEEAGYYKGHAPIVLRDSIPYIDFLFVNRRGAVETCSAQMLEAMDISVDIQHYARVEGPSFWPRRTLAALGSDGRRSWQMSSGFVTREWAEWWTQEFLGGKRKQWWMRYQGPGATSASFVPVIVEPAKKQTTIYDRSKQQMPHVDFTVTLALEG